jgi:hypothetical protein
MRFKLEHDLTDLASKVSSDIDRLKARADEESKTIAAQVRAFIIGKALNELNSFQQQAYLGKDHENVKMSRLGDGIYLIELDNKALEIENGSPKKFMRWLIDKNPKAKTAKDGSRYAHIPFSQNGPGKKGATSKVNDPRAAFFDIVNKTLKDQNIDLKKIETNSDGTPKLGVLHKVDMSSFIAGDKNRSNFSMPRSQEMAAKIGLQPHTGIHKLQGLVVTQRMGKDGKVVKEAMTFRTISTKHEAEGRWYYPEQKPLNAFPAAYDFAKTLMDEAIRRLNQEFGGR